MALTLPRCQEGDVVRVLREGELCLVRLYFRFQFGDWLSRVVELDGDRIRDLTEAFVLPDATPVLERVVDRAWYVRRSAAAAGNTESIDPLLGGVR